jgi:ribosomal protein S18 acetylase RimI-like enzyme
MAALPKSAANQIVDLRKIAGKDLDAVLQEEIAAWRDGLDWDLQPAAELVRRFVDMQALNGYALVDGSRIVGYSYSVQDARKGLIGDLYISEHERTPAREFALLDATLEALWRTPGVQRVEAQLLMLRPGRISPQDAQRMPFPNWFRPHPRRFMELGAQQIVRLPARGLDGVSIVPWTENRQDDAARLVAAAYRGHIDGEINDQYRSPDGARRFLSNIIQYPGCGTFFAPAAYAALDARGALCGISLTSMVAADTGHVTQVCVAPAHKGTGVGYALLRSSLLALTAHGCHRASLTVTSANTGAVSLYEQMGFSDRREFTAFVWHS